MGLHTVQKKFNLKQNSQGSVEYSYKIKTYGIW